MNIWSDVEVEEKVFMRLGDLLDAIHSLEHRYGRETAVLGPEGNPLELCINYDENEKVAVHFIE